MIIRGGLVVDGTGAAPRLADVAIANGHIVDVGDLSSQTADSEIDACGLLVTPGFVDVHTHYDGQVTWDEVLEPSTPHGVTTVITGNCGVGFAPVRPGSEALLIELMEGVEDIPGAALHEGMTWGWETFPEYVEQLAGRQWTADVGVQLPHGPLRSYVMGERGATNQQASEAEIHEMSRIVSEAMQAGAFGFTTSRTLGHKSLDGTPVPGTFAADDELFAIARAVRDGGGRIFEVAAAGITQLDAPSVVATELDWIGRMALETGLTATFIVLQHDEAPNRWRDEMSKAAEWREQGSNVVPLVAGRPFGVLLGWDVRHPFRLRPTYEAIAGLSLQERLVELRKTEVRERILAEETVTDNEVARLGQEGIRAFTPRCYVLSDNPDYEQPLAQSLGAMAASSGKTVEELTYDLLLTGDGTSVLLLPLFNYADGDHEALYEQMLDPAAILGLADGGAHCGAICDASIPTYMLTHWVRDRARGPKLALEDVIRRLTSQPADLYGLSDRGRLAPGQRADVNIIDLDALRLRSPRAVADLPAGGIRLLQDAVGYRATIVNGEITRRDGRDTGARPGRLIRHTQPA
jgi:N-acyl-D-amino-acid deacylase